MADIPYPICSLQPIREHIEEAAITPTTVPAKIAITALGKLCRFASRPTAIIAILMLDRMTKNFVLTRVNAPVKNSPKSISILPVSALLATN